MKNMNDFQLTAMGREEMQSTDGGADWKEYVFRFLLNEIQDICKGFEDAVNSVDRQYK